MKKIVCVNSKLQESTSNKKVFLRIEILSNGVKWKRPYNLVNQVDGLFGLIAKVELGRRSRQNPFRSLETETRERFCYGLNCNRKNDKTRRNSVK